MAVLIEVARDMHYPLAMIEALLETVLLSSLVTLIIGAGLLLRRLRSGRRLFEP